MDINVSGKTIENDNIKNDDVSENTQVNGIQVFNINGVDCYEKDGIAYGKMIWREYKGEIIEAKKHCGVVYAVEFGKYIKIGSTSCIPRRYKQLKQIAENYAFSKFGKFYYSQQHENYFKNERKIHKILENFRIKRTEMFDLSMCEFLERICGNIFKLSREIKNYEEYAEFLKNILMGNYGQILKDKPCEDIDKLFRDTYCTYCTDDEFLEIMSIVKNLGNHANNSVTFNYYIARLQNIIGLSQERELKKMICS